MDDWRDLDGDAIGAGSTDYLRALKRSNEGNAASAAASAPTMARNPAPDTVLVNRRGSPRYKCEGGVEFYIEGSDVRTWGMVSDVSRSGCYVEMHATSPVDTPVNMRLDVNGFRIHAKGIVRTSYPSLGMGIAFTGLDEANGVQLDELLLHLSGGVLPPRAPAGPQQSSGPSGLLMVTNPSSALNAIATFFRSHRAMSREEFEELILRSQNSGQQRSR